MSPPATANLASSSVSRESAATATCGLKLQQHRRFPSLALSGLGTLTGLAQKPQVDRRSQSVRGKRASKLRLFLPGCFGLSGKPLPIVMDEDEMPSVSPRLAAPADISRLREEAKSEHCWVTPDAPAMRESPDLPAAREQTLQDDDFAHDTTSLQPAWQWDGVVADPFQVDSADGTSLCYSPSVLPTPSPSPFTLLDETITDPLQADLLQGDIRIDDQAMVIQLQSPTLTLWEESINDPLQVDLAQSGIRLEESTIIAIPKYFDMAAADEQDADDEYFPVDTSGVHRNADFPGCCLTSSSAVDTEFAHSGLSDQLPDHI